MTVEAMELPTDNFPVGKAEDKEIDEKRALSGISKEVQLKIDPEIQNLCPPLDKEAYALLKKDLQENGCRDPIIYWEDHDIIVDGHNRYDICTKKPKIPFDCVSMPFETKEDVMNYVIDHQLGRRNLSNLEKAYLRGKRYLTEKKAAHRPNSSELHQDDGVKGETAKKVAEETGVSQATIERDAVLAEAIDALRDGIGDEFSKKLRSGKVKLSKKDTIELAKKPAEVLKSLGELIEKGETPAKAIEIVQSPKTLSSGQESNLASPIKADKKLEKVEQYLSKALLALEKMETAHQPDQVASLSEIAQKIFDKLKTIGAKTPDQAAKNAPIVSDDLQTEIKGESNEPNSDNSTSLNDGAMAVLDVDGEELANDSTERFADMPEGWEEYQEAIESENEE